MKFLSSAFALVSWPSIPTCSAVLIAKHTNAGPATKQLAKRYTVAKYVGNLERKGLIQTENTTVTTKAGAKRNGNLLYTVSPFQDVLEAHHQRQLERLAQETTRAQLQLGA